MMLKQLSLTITIVFAAIAASWAFYNHYEKLENRLSNDLKMLHVEQCRLSSDVRVIESIINTRGSKNGM